MIKYYFCRFLSYLFNPKATRNLHRHKTARISFGCQIINSTIGRYSYIGGHSTVIDTEIGNFCSIASNCIIGGASHPITWVSTSPIFHSGRNIMRTNFSNNSYEPYKKTVICNDVWIGSNCLIKAGVRVGNGAIIGMGSIVTRDVPDFEIWAGNPARFIRKRFCDDDIQKLLKIRWWMWPDEVIKKEADIFCDINAFCSKFSDNS